jgi:ubiquinone/menaquinone biosynthesis C-methylase UbiE
MSRFHEANVQTQFGPRANAYVESVVHSTGNDLKALESLVGKARPSHALDLGTGGGHVAYALARHAGKVTAADLSSAMLSAVAATAAARGIGNIETAETAAESLPFADESFDFLATRFSAHHWRDVEAGLREGRRVTKRGCPAVFIDVFAPASPLNDTHLQAIELLRDTSHVRDYSLPQWLASLSRSGFSVRNCTTWQLRMDFATWVERMATPPELVTAIRALQLAAAAEVRAHFAIEPDGSFALDMMMIEAVAD